MIGAPVVDCALVDSGDAGASEGVGSDVEDVIPAEPHDTVATAAMAAQQISAATVLRNVTKPDCQDEAPVRTQRPRARRFDQYAERVGSGAEGASRARGGRSSRP